ncbi:MAG: hypothetical protein K6E58_04985 [Eubacterium sp.]|nr:hypothetical protein [Eubacterium sp.]
MKKSIFRRIIVSVLSLALVFSFSGPVSAASHAANGADILPNNTKWETFSVRDDLHGLPYTEWEIALLKEMDSALKTLFGKYYTNVKTYTPENVENNRNAAMDLATTDYNAGKVTQAQYDKYVLESGWDKEHGIMAWQSGTEAWINGDSSPKNVSLWCASTGWDGEYASKTKGGQKTLVGDNPWGLTLTMDKIPVEYGRYYTMEFDIDTDLYYKDEETGKYVKPGKYCLVKAYDYQSNGGPAAAFETFTVSGKEGSKDGRFKIPATPNFSDPNTVAHVVGTFRIPDTKEEWSGGHDKGAFTYMGIKFAAGAFSKTHENEVKAGTAKEQEEQNLKGAINVKNLKITAGTQYAVRYYDSYTLKATKWVNEYEQAKWLALKKKNYTLDSYTNIATGTKYNFGTLVDKDLSLRAKWVKTKKPKKASFKLKSKKKRKVTVTFKKNVNAKGYQVKYSYSKKFKKKKKFKTKTKNTSKTKTYTIKSLKSSKVLYVKARGYNKDSCGRKIYGKWSKRKAVYVK